MPSIPARPGALLLLGLAILWLAGATLRADLVWTAQTGWRLEGGALSGLTAGEGRTALALMNSARAAEEKKNYWSAARAYERVGKRYPNSVYAPEAMYRAALMRLARRQYYIAFDDFRAVTDRYPNSTRFNEVVGEQYRVASSLLDGRRNRMWFGFVPGPKFPERGIEYFETIIQAAPYSDYAPLAMMNVARGYTKLGNTEATIDALDRMINNYPKHLLTPDAMLKLGQAHESYMDGAAYDQTASRDAASYYQDFIIYYPNDPAVAKAEVGLDKARTQIAESKLVMADFYFYKRKTPAGRLAARVLYNDAITAYPGSPVAAKARQQLDALDAIEGNTPTPSNAPAASPAAPANATLTVKKRKWYWPFGN
jgi:outer membrane protein assembly factor BamD